MGRKEMQSLFSLITAAGFFTAAFFTGRQAAVLTGKFRVEREQSRQSRTKYYLVKKTACPIVIVECGFLSNPQEEALLTDSVYQERVAWNIFMGIMQELKMKKE